MVPVPWMPSFGCAIWSSICCGVYSSMYDMFDNWPADCVCVLCVGAVLWHGVQSFCSEVTPSVICEAP